MEHSPIGSDFQDFLDDLWAEAEQEGIDAVREVAFAEARARLARQINAARRAHGLTQTHLAQETSIDQAEISRIESGQGNPTLRTLALLARVLGCDISLAPQENERAATVVKAVPLESSRVDVQRRGDVGTKSSPKYTQRNRLATSEIGPSPGNQSSKAPADSPGRSLGGRRNIKS